jgi:hypothetical protein
MIESARYLRRRLRTCFAASSKLGRTVGKRCVPLQIIRVQGNLGMFIGDFDSLLGL